MRENVRERERDRERQRDGAAATRRELPGFPCQASKMATELLEVEEKKRRDVEVPGPSTTRAGIRLSENRLAP